MATVLKQQSIKCHYFCNSLQRRNIMLIHPYVMCSVAAKYLKMSFLFSFWCVCAAAKAVVILSLCAISHFSFAALC